MIKKTFTLNDAAPWAITLAVILAFTGAVFASENAHAIHKLVNVLALAGVLVAAAVHFRREHQKAVAWNAAPKLFGDVALFGGEVICEYMDNYDRYYIPLDVVSF